MGIGRATWLAAWLLAAACAHSAEAIEPEEAAAHVGEHARVCGIVASAKFARDSRGQPTFLNLGKAYPDQVFTALVWGSDRPAFPYPPESLEGRGICVTGVISEYKGKPQIIVSGPAQISMRPGGGP